MTTIEDVLIALGGPGMTLAGADEHVPPTPGLYAISADPAIWETLGLGSPPDDRPLYIGKAENSLTARDLRTHFGHGHTGSSTVRRSFAALLRERLRLSAQPRNPAKPERFANYGLSPTHDDARLTTWMRQHLRLAVWSTDHRAALGDIEIAVLAIWQPPLNLKDVVTPWQSEVRAARALMATEAKARATST
jgi:hypothetical protein